MADIQSDKKHCDRKDENGVQCTELANMAYIWAWGEQGICCPKHAALMQQSAEQLGRSVSIYPLPNQVAPDLTRDERTQLVAKSIAATAEADELKLRGLELYRMNSQQQATINTLTVQKRELEAQTRDLEATITTLRGQVETRDAEHAELVLEIERLRHLEALWDAAPSRAGSQEPPSRNVVEG